MFGIVVTFKPDGLKTEGAVDRELLKGLGSD